MKAALLCAFLSVLSAVKSLPSSQQSCHCTFGQECWPTASDFHTLASQISQPLIYPVPPASACYPGSPPSGNCTEVVNQWSNSNWRADQTGATDLINWGTYTFPNGTIEACYLDTTLGVPCGQGSVPPIGVDVRTVADVQAAVKFATKHNLRVSIKNTGHDFMGRSTARGSFLIWTHNLKNITFSDSFTPYGSNATYDNVLTVSSGVQWFEAYDVAAALNRVIVGGVTVGGSVGSAGGWILGGGHSALSPSYGIGVDNVVQMTIVTADGSHLTANQDNNPDLFWALRGGGGGTFGILTSVSYKTHPVTPMITVLLIARRTETNYTDPLAPQKIFADFASRSSMYSDLGYGGYGAGDPTQFSTLLINPGATAAQANVAFGPYLEYAQSLAVAGGLTIQQEIVTYSSFNQWYQENSQVIGRIAGNFRDIGGVGGNVEYTSWLLPKDVLDNQSQMVAEKLMQVTEGFNYNLITGGAVSHVDPDSMGVNPAWRKSSGFVFTGFGWPEGATSAEINALRAGFKEQMKIIESIAPDSGAYLNEASPYEFDFKKSFFGSHYDKLKAIKYKYDPNAMFVVWEGVGSDDFYSTLNCRVNVWQTSGESKFYKSWQAFITALRILFRT